MRNIRLNNIHIYVVSTVSELYEWGSRMYMLMMTVQWVSVAGSEALWPGGKSFL